MEETEYREKEKRSFWLSLFSAVGVLILLGVILFLSQSGKQESASSPSSPEEGIGGGPGSEITVPDQTPSGEQMQFESPATEAPQSYSL